MRVWDLPVECLCRNHLLAEHRELHAIWNIILNDKRGYSRHPEVLRWKGKLRALWRRHEQQEMEMIKRGYSHSSPIHLREIPKRHRGAIQTALIDSIESQRHRIRLKGCECDVSEKLSRRKRRKGKV